jgi:hypothetical protein
MGCDIHVKAYKKQDNKYCEISQNFFDTRSYALFGFLAGVRNYSGIAPISNPRGLPDWYNSGNPKSKGLSDWYKGYDDDDWCYHSHSWLTLDELESYDYDQITEDRRCTVGNDGGCTCAPGQGEKMTLRDFLGEWYFKEIAEIKDAGIDVIVFWFDS